MEFCEKLQELRKNRISEGGKSCFFADVRTAALFATSVSIFANVEFSAKLQDMHAEEMIELKQAAYDRYLSK